MRIVERYKRLLTVMGLMAVMCIPLVAKPSATLLDQLNSDEFDVRNRAYVELRKWAHENLKSSPEQLHKVWKESKHPEVKSRCYEMMKDAVILRKFGKGRGFIGIRMQETIVRDPAGNGLKSGVEITQVMQDTPGQKAGLKMDDVILGVDQLEFGKAVHVHRQQANPFGFRPDSGTVTRFGNYIQSKQPDENVTLHILRNGKKIKIKVKLMKRPASADAEVLGGVNRQAEQEAFFRSWLESLDK